MILLDTHYWIWLNIDDTRFSSRASALDFSEFAISAITVWETVMCFERGVFKTGVGPEREIKSWLKVNPVRMIPIDEKIAILSRTLAFEHNDPADRFIAATAVCHKCKVATDDQKLRALPWLNCLP